MQTITLTVHNGPIRLVFEWTDRNGVPHAMPLIAQLGPNSGNPETLQICEERLDGLGEETFNGRPLIVQTAKGDILSVLRPDQLGTCPHPYFSQEEI